MRVKVVTHSFRILAIRESEELMIETIAIGIPPEKGLMIN